MFLLGTGLFIKIVIGVIGASGLALGGDILHDYASKKLKKIKESDKKKA